MTTQTNAAPKPGANPQAEQDHCEDDLDMVTARQIAREYAWPHSNVDAGNLYWALHVCLRRIDTAHAQAEPQGPLFLLHCGAVSDGEQDEWEVEANSGKAVEAFAAQYPGKTIGLFAHPPAAQAEPRKPLTDAAIQARFTATYRGVNSTALAFSSFEAGIRWAEQQHGIGGEE